MTTLRLSAIVVGTAVALAACVVVPPPVVVGFNGDSVDIQTSALEPIPSGTTQAEANRICGQADKRAEYASSRPVPEGHIHLYLCLDA